MSGVKWHTYEEAQVGSCRAYVDDDGRLWRWQVWSGFVCKFNGHATSRLKAHNAAVKAAKGLRGSP